MDDAIKGSESEWRRGLEGYRLSDGGVSNSMDFEPAWRYQGRLKFLYGPRCTIAADPPFLFLCLRAQGIY